MTATGTRCVPCHLRRASDSGPGWLKWQGDGDPIDVVEVGSGVLATGAVRLVKPLGVLCMIDDGEAGHALDLFAASHLFFSRTVRKAKAREAQPVCERKGV